MLTRHEESRAVVRSSPERVFAHLDDHTRLSSHMSRSSWMMGGGRMETILDAQRGQSVGSVIKLDGVVFGIRLFVEEVITERIPPHRKVWETVGTPRLLVIAAYRMGFDLTPHADGSELRVSIDYALPESGISHWLGRAFGGYYARWCTRRMVIDASRAFAIEAAPSSLSPGGSMRLDSRAFGLAAGTVAALLFVLCAVAVAIAPTWTTTMASSLIHLDLSGIARTITWASFFGGLLFWSIATGLVFATVGGLYNRFLGQHSALASTDVAAHRLA